MEPGDDGKVESKRASTPGRADHLYRSFVSTHGSFYKSETKTRSFYVMHVVRWHPVKLLEDTALMNLRYTNTMVFNLYKRFNPLPACTNPDALFVLAVFNRIVQQIHNRFSHRFFISQDHRFFIRRLKLELKSTLFHMRLV